MTNSKLIEDHQRNERVENSRDALCKRLGCWHAWSVGSVNHYFNLRRVRDGWNENEDDAPLTFMGLPSTRRPFNSLAALAAVSGLLKTIEAIPRLVPFWL